MFTFELKGDFGDPASHLPSYLWGFLFGSLFGILKRISFSPPSPTIKLKISARSEGFARIKAEGEKSSLDFGWNVVGIKHVAI